MSHSDRSHALLPLVESTLQDVLSAGQPRRMPPARNRTRFCKDLLAVSLGVRMSYLLDAFALETGTLRALITRLNEADPANFAELDHVHEETTSQLFLVNRNLLSTRLSSSSESVPSFFVSVTSPSAPFLMPSPPPSLTNLLNHLRTSLAPTSSPRQYGLSLSAPHPEDAITLAGWLLEYPVCYVLEPDSNGNTLGGRALRLVRFTLRGFREGDDHDFLSFTYPVGIAPSPSPDLLVRNTHRILRDRLARSMGTLLWRDVDVTEDTVERDTIAL